jgi:hypothetical protein
VTATIDLTNTAPPGGTPQYIFGPNTDPGDPPGEYRGLVSLYLPPYTYLSGAQGDSTTTSAILGSQNGITTITFNVDIPAGRSSHQVLHLQLPPNLGVTPHFVFVPTPRVIPTQYVADLTP